MRGHNQRFQTSRSRVPNAYGGRKGDSNGVHLSTREQVPAICDGSKKSIKNIFSNIFKICEISFPGIHRDSFIFACIVVYTRIFFLHASLPGVTLHCMGHIVFGAKSTICGTFLKSLPMLDAGIPDAPEQRKTKKLFTH